MIHFPFDIEAYLKVRNFYVEYSDFTFGPEVVNTQDLIELIISMKWKNINPFQEKRDAWKKRYFPTESPNYTDRTFETIRALLKKKREAT